MKLKLNKNFQPPLADEGDEFFPNGIFEFNITKLLAFIASNPSMFPVEKVDVRQFPIWESQNLNEVTIETADLTKPIIVGEISPGRFNVIDGNHRLEKARRQGISKIPGYRVMAHHHMPFLTSKESYSAYIEYWNSKVADMSRRSSIP